MDRYYYTVDAKRKTALPQAEGTSPDEGTAGERAGQPPADRQDGRGGAAFLLTQLGAHAAGRFAQRVAEIDLTPPQAGVLRQIATQPGLSQQELATRLGLFPSRMVAFVDELVGRGLVVRDRRPDDRRVYALSLTKQGADTLRRIAEIGRAHERDITSPLSADEHATLTALLRRLAAHHDLEPHIHPGYRSL
jgi:DNA-binding MarR family transcriptional regulator